MMVKLGECTSGRARTEPFGHRHPYDGFCFLAVLEGIELPVATMRLLASEVKVVQPQDVQAVLLSIRHASHAALPVDFNKGCVRLSADA